MDRALLAVLFALAFLVVPFEAQVTNAQNSPTAIQEHLVIQETVYAFDGWNFLHSFNATTGSRVELNLSLTGDNSYAIHIKIQSVNHGEIFNYTTYGESVKVTNINQIINLSYDDSYNITMTKSPFFTTVTVNGIIDLYSKENTEPTATPTVVLAKNFTSSDIFSIPLLNSTINFAYNGSYHVATFEDNFWSFGGLTLSGLGSSVNRSHSLDVSAQNCNITITHIDTLTWLDQVGWLTYNVEGVGNQTFNMHWRAEGFVIGFKVYIDGVAKDAGDGWTGWSGKNPVTDNMLTVTGAKSNVSIGYAHNRETIGSEPNFAPLALPSPSPIASLSSPTIEPNLTPTSSASPTTTVPEFQMWIILPLALITALIAIIVRRKKRT